MNNLTIVCLILIIFTMTMYYIAYRVYVYQNKDNKQFNDLFKDC